jgi:hypothetical protein
MIEVATHVITFVVVLSLPYILFLRALRKLSRQKSELVYRFPRGASQS